jgi:hypothetical protein
MAEECSCKTEVLEAKIKALEHVMAERDIRYTERFVAQEKAERLFTQSLDSWKIHTNEWRGAMEDRERRFLPRSLGAVIGALTLLLLIFQVLSLMDAQP